MGGSIHGLGEGGGKELVVVCCYQWIVVEEAGGYVVAFVVICRRRLILRISKVVGHSRENTEKLALYSLDEAQEFGAIMQTSSIADWHPACNSLSYVPRPNYAHRYPHHILIIPFRPPLLPTHACMSPQKPPKSPDPLP